MRKRTGKPRGRPKGSLNKATAEIKSLAQEHGATAIETLVRLMKKGRSERTRICAASELLDRGYGRATQSHEHAGPNGGPMTYREEVPVERREPDPMAGSARPPA